MIKWVKNTSGSVKTWVGQEIADATYHQVPEADAIRWANDSTLLTAIGNADATVAADNSGSTDITDVNQAVNFLKGNLPAEVTTQFEKTDKFLKMAKGSAVVQADKYATIELRVPGTFNGVDPTSSNGSWIDGGIAWFSSAEDGDYIESIEVVDIDNVLGYGSGVVVKTYHDDSIGIANSGWFIPPGGVTVQALGGYGFLPSGMYLRLMGKKTTASTGTLYVNIKWGRV